MEEMDFNDVFGGPPRRFSMPEMRVRYSFGNDQSEEEGESSEKPVFGGESSAAAARRRRQGGDDFYGDIFRGEEYSGSRIMSPVAVRPKSDTFGTSLPPLLSLPAKLTSAMEFPRNNSRNTMDRSTNGLNSPRSLSSLSRFSNLGILGHDGIGNEAHHRSTLSPDASSRTEENVKNDARNEEGFGNQFHFSIYSWAGGGAPMLMPVGVGKNLESKDISVNDMIASSNGESDCIEIEKRDLQSKEETKKLQNSFQEAVYYSPESKSRSSSKEGVVFGRNKQNIKDEQVKSIDKTDKKKKIEENSGTGSGKSRVKGKVSNFVQIFNHELDSKPKADIKTRSQSFRWKDIGVNQEKNEVSFNAAKVNEKLNLKNADKNPDVFLKINENINEETQHSHRKDPSSRSHHFLANQQNAFSSDLTYKDSKISVENSDDPLQDNFMVHEIFDDDEKVEQSEASEDIKALDTKIQQWSVGKKGNIRSLLSTLQYVLWDGSGWKQVALVDLIEENSVKRAYQKALLRLHPDKLQQKDAAVHHKYIAEKVFDILQEAWDGFNNLAPL